MKQRTRSLPLLVVVAVVALVLGSFGTAVAAAPITKAKVKKVAAKIVHKEAPSLSVAHAATADNATNASTLGGLPASSLVRATTASAGNLTDPCAAGAISTSFTAAAYTTLVSKAFTAPTAGILVITGGSTQERASSSAAGSGLRFDGRVTVDGAQAGMTGETALTDVSGPDCSDANTIALSTAVQVAAGAHTVAYQAKRAGGTAAAWLSSAQVTVMFVPFGAAGTAGVLGKSHTDGAGAGSNNH